MRRRAKANGSAHGRGPSARRRIKLGKSEREDDVMASLPQETGLSRRHAALLKRWTQPRPGQLSGVDLASNALYA